MNAGVQSNKVMDYLKLIRPSHYVKNLLVFFPLFFSGNLLCMEKVFACVLAFFSFSFAASTVYVINDIYDKEKDARHPQNRNRPIAAGRISIREGVGISIILLILSLLLSSPILLVEGSDFSKFHWWYIGLYLLLNFSYSFSLKNIPLLEIIILVSGFIIRVMYGAAVVDVKVSDWLFLTVLSLSFFLCLGKRRNEMRKSGEGTRKVLKYYSPEFLDKNMYVCLALSIVFYALWCIDLSKVGRGGGYLVWTVPLVILILMRYSMNVEKEEYADPTDMVLKDKYMLILLFLYFITVTAVIYLF